MGHVYAGDVPPTGADSDDLWLNTKTGIPQHWNGFAFTEAKAVIALAAGATVAIDATLGETFTLTPAQGETITIAPNIAGKRIALVITTSGTVSFTLTFGTGFKSTGTLATGTTSAKVFTIQFVCDGTNWNEVSRTTAM